MQNRQSRPDAPGRGPWGTQAPALASSLLDAVPDPLVVTDAAGIVLAWNRAAEELYGIDAVDAVGLPMDRLVRSTDRPGPRRRAADTPLIGRRAGDEIVVEVSAGEARPTEGEGADRDRRARRVEIRRDVTEAARLEAELEASGLLARSPDDLARLRTELARGQKLEILGQLIGGVAHELNNPLAAIVAFSELIHRDPRLPDDMRDDAAMLAREADRARRVADALVDVVRVRPPERHPTSIRALVDNVLALQTYSLGSSGLAVAVRVPPDLPAASIDRALVQQVLLNLTMNAARAIRSAGQGSRLEISAGLVGSDEERAIRVMVADDGPGVGSQHRPMLFQPFFTTSQTGEATGLGLSVSAEIVAAHGGRLSYEPGPGGHGATFIVELPIGAPVAEPVAPSVTPARSIGPDDATPMAAGRDGERILVLDDEPSIRAFLGRVLRNAGYVGILASTGREAVEEVRTGEVAAILCDYRMAGVTGTDVYEEVVRLRPELAGRFAFMSGDVMNPELVRFAEERGIALLAKPFDIESVELILRELIRAEPRR